MKIILPINLDVNIDINCFDYYRLSVLLTDDRFLPWYVERFISMHMDETYICQYYEMDTFESLDYLFLYDEVLEFREIQNKSNIVSSIIHSINNNEYLILRCDDYYIEGSKAYNKAHNLHGMLVCGYDDMLQKIYFVDNYVNGIKWAINSISFSQLENAFFYGIENIRDGIESNPNLKVLLKLNEPATSFFVKNKNFNRESRLNVIHNSLSNFLSGGVFINKTNPTYIRRTGISIYKAFYEDLFDTILDDKKNLLKENRKILLGFKRFIENKRGLLFRFKYLNDKKLVRINEQLINKQNILCDNLENAFNLITKYSFSLTPADLKRASYILKETEDLDITILNEVIDSVYNAMLKRI